jgi:hypothetical protein
MKKDKKKYPVVGEISCIPWTEPQDPGAGVSACSPGLSADYLLDKNKNIFCFSGADLDPNPNWILIHLGQ